MTPSRPLRVRPDAELRGLDVTAALTRGLLLDGAPRRMLFGDAAVAAALEAEARGVGPYPVRFLAGFVRSAGVAEALQLPEPLILPHQTELAREWLQAALGAGSGLDLDELTARWLEMVAALLDVRRRARDGNR